MKGAIADGVAEHALSRHPSGPPPAAAFAVLVRAEVTPGGAVLELAYRLCGDLTQMHIPVPVPSQRADRLWERTCFEAFVQPEGEERYWELNFSPSGEWAGYAFERYRHGVRPLPLASPPRIAVVKEARELRVTVRVDLGVLADAPLPWRVGLTAVVEDAVGGLSYWALRHSGPKPDFHDAACFLVRMEGRAR